MMRSQEMLHKISASLAQCHVKGELDYSLDQLIQQWQIFLGGKTKFHKGSIWARIVKNCESLFYWQVLHRSHTWILKRMTKPSKLGGAPVRTQPHIEETTSYFSKCFLLSGTNDMPFPSPLSFSLQEHQIQKPMVQPTKNPCFGFFIAYSNARLFQVRLKPLIDAARREKSIHPGNKSWVRGHDYKMLCAGMQKKTCFIKTVAL